MRTGLLRTAHVLALTVVIGGTAEATEDGKTSAKGQDTLTNGDFYYGVTTTVFKLQSTRDAGEPARARDYRMQLDKLPLDVGFQFTWRPNCCAYRRKTTDGKDLQLMSFGGLISVTPDSKLPRNSEVTIAFVLSFFNERVSVGLGFDLYRGIPVRGADGAAGSETASTGLLGWAWARQGEITPENFSLLLMFNLLPGQAQGDAP